MPARNALPFSLPLAALSMPAVAGGIDEAIATTFQPIADAVAGFVFAAISVGTAKVPWILFWLIAAGIFCTLYFRFINVRGMAQGMRIIRGDYEAPDHAGDTTHFQALATALSGTVGLGNIAGVAVAVTIGGPGVKAKGGAGRHSGDTAARPRRSQPGREVSATAPAPT